MARTHPAKKVVGRHSLTNSKEFKINWNVFKLLSFRFIFRFFTIMQSKHSTGNYSIAIISPCRRWAVRCVVALTCFITYESVVFSLSDMLRFRFIWLKYESDLTHFRTILCKPKAVVNCISWDVRRWRTSRPIGIPATLSHWLREFFLLI